MMREMTAKDIVPRLAAMLKSRRRELRISRLQLADQAGVRASVVWRAERGQDSRLTTWAKLFEGLGSPLIINMKDVDEDTEIMSRDEWSYRKERQLRGLGL
jgi:transcriptional regulator with XRE-family HTH domain